MVMLEYPHEVDLLHYTTTTDPNSGERTQTWATEVGGIPAEVTTPTGTEIMEAMKMENPLDYTIHMDYDERVKSEKRIQFKGMTLAIHAVLPTMPDINGDFEKLTLKCSSNLR